MFAKQHLDLFGCTHYLSCYWQHLFQNYWIISDKIPGIYVLFLVVDFLSCSWNNQMMNVRQTLTWACRANPSQCLTMKWSNALLAYWSSPEWEFGVIRCIKSNGVSRSFNIVTYLSFCFGKLIIMSPRTIN